MNTRLDSTRSRQATGGTIYFCGGGAREMKTSRVEIFKNRVCSVFFDLSSGQELLRLWCERGMRRKKKEGGNKEDGEGIEDTNEQFSFSSRGICYLDRNFLPFGRVRGEICQNWINETIMFLDGFFVEQIVQWLICIIIYDREILRVD